MTDTPNVDAQATFGTDGSLETPDTVDTDLEDYGADCDNSERETQLDRPEADAFGVDDRPDYENDPDAGEQSDITPEKDENQRDLEGDAAEYPPEWLDSDADEWGPTMDRPIPDAERKLIGVEKIDKRRLAGTGATPEDFELVGEKWWGRSTNYGFHAADAEPRNAEYPRAEVFDEPHSDAGEFDQEVATDGGMDYPDPTLHPDAYEAHEAAPVEIGDEVLVHMVEGAGAWEEEFPIRYTVKSIDSPNGLSIRNDYILRVSHENPPYMVDGCSDTTILTQLRRGESWELVDDSDGLDTGDGIATDGGRPVDEKFCTHCGWTGEAPSPPSDECPDCAGPLTEARWIRPEHDGELPDRESVIRDTVADLKTAIDPDHIHTSQHALDRIEELIELLQTIQQTNESSEKVLMTDGGRDIGEPLTNQPTDTKTMTQNDDATTDERTENKRFDDEFGLDDVIEGDRIDPPLIPRNQEFDVGDPVRDNLARQADDDDREFTVRLIAGGNDRYNDVQTALVYDPEADLFARLSGHTHSGAMNQKERDYKVREVGQEVVVKDAWDVEIPDLPDDETEREFVEVWVEIAFDNARYGEDVNELETFDGKKFTFRDWDNRTARVQYVLE